MENIVGMNGTNKNQEAIKTIKRALSELLPGSHITLYHVRRDEHTTFSLGQDIREEAGETERGKT